MAQVRGDLRQGDEDESPLRQSRVRDGEVSGLELFTFIEEDININNPGCVAEAGKPSEFFLRLLDKSQKLAWDKAGAYLTDGIEEGGLLRKANGFRLVEGRTPLRLHLAFITEGLYSPVKVMSAVPQVRTQPKINSPHLSYRLFPYHSVAHFTDLYHGEDIMDPHYVCTLGDADSQGDRRALLPLVGRPTQYPAYHGLS